MQWLLLSNSGKNTTRHKNHGWRVAYNHRRQSIIEHAHIERRKTERHRVRDRGRQRHRERKTGRGRDRGKRDRETDRVEDRVRKRDAERSRDIDKERWLILLEVRRRRQDVCLGLGRQMKGTQVERAAQANSRGWHENSWTERRVLCRSKAESRENPGSVRRTPG